MNVAAHVILGQREEPFLGALLASLEGVVTHVIVNDNSSTAHPSPHARTLMESTFAQAGTLHVDRTPFTDFSNARNVCLRMHAELDAGKWIAFVDADEVHGELVRRIAENLDHVPADTDFVEGYTWHFFQSPDWYTSIERRLTFFRYTPEVRWEGNVHERLAGLSGKRLVLPYVYGHYGHVLPPRRHAEKGRHYSSLGQAGEIVPESELDRIDPEYYFRDFWPRLLRFNGTHAPAAQPILNRLRSELHDQFQQTDEFVRKHQPPLVRMRNVLEKLNYEQRWRLRTLQPQARALLAPQ